MAKRKRWSTGERETFWRQQIADWKQSGQTIGALCGERILRHRKANYRRVLGVLFEDMRLDRPYPITFGNAVDQETQALIRAEQAAGVLPEDMVVNQGAANINPDLPNSYNNRLRPDIRLPLGNGREAVWDLTTKAQAGVLEGHSAKYGSFDFVDYAADLPYER
jgi:hypothetical protein